MSNNKNDFEAANARFAEEFRHGDKPMPPKRQVVVLTCMDARIHPEKVLGLDTGDAHVFRNAGGRATEDALRSIAISQRLLGTKEVFVIHHTDCGLLTFSNDDIRAKIKADLGTEAYQQAADIEFLPFSDLQQSVRDDIRTIKGSKNVDPSTRTYGYVYDLTNGKLAPVQA
eukprot:jgi/Chrzof1/1358/Cz10g04110.t1